MRSERDKATEHQSDAPRDAIGRVDETQTDMQLSVRRPPLRFSLRFVLIVVTAFSIGLAILTHFSQKSSHEFALKDAKAELGLFLMRSHSQYWHQDATLDRIVSQMASDISGSNASSWTFDVIDAAKDIRNIGEPQLRKSSKNSR